MDFDSTVVVESSLSSLVPISILTPDVATNSEFEFENHDTRADRINTIFLKDLKLTITSPSGETFSFINSLELYISSPSFSEKKVAFKENIPSTAGKEIICDLVDLDLKDFIKEDKFKLRLVSVSDETIPEDVTINVYTNFLVDAKIKK